jgi:hypothetical protein
MLQSADTHNSPDLDRCVLSIQDNTEPQGNPSKTVLHTCKANTLLTNIVFRQIPHAVVSVSKDGSVGLLIKLIN